MLEQLAETLIHANGASRATDVAIKQVFNDPKVGFEFREGHSIEIAPAYTNSIDESVRIAQRYGGYDFAMEQLTAAVENAAYDSRALSITEKVSQHLLRALTRYAVNTRHQPEG